MWPYYVHLSFLKREFFLFYYYLNKNPFRISKNFLIKKGASNIYQYGETPLSTLALISKKAGLSSKDIVYELGCGRGKTLFWLNFFYKCQVVGIEFIPDFVEIGNKIVEKMNEDKIVFLHRDILQIDLTPATFIYLYGTTFEEDFIKELIEKFRLLKRGTRIITTSYPLSDYIVDPLFQHLESFTAKFPWGETLVYLQIKN